MVSEFQNIFSSFQNGILSLDPVYWVEKHLTIDGRDFDLSSGAWKPFADIYRYVGLKSTEPNALPVVVLKSRQTGGTVMANAIELYMMGCNMYGNTKPPMRIIHAFPTLEMAKTYSKTKFSQMVGSAKILNHTQKKSDVKNCIQEMVDSDFNSSVHFKPFIGGNHIWIDSTGITGDRLRGRQLCLETELPTPDKGFIKLKYLKEGDKLFDENGNICNVTKLHPINLSPESYRITFDDETTVDACAEHLWLTYSRTEKVLRKPPSIKNTKEIINTLKVNGESNHCILTCRPVQYNEQELPIDPYLFGFQLDENDIPENYLKSSINQRLSLLQGLMDSKGSLTMNGGCEFTTTNEKLLNSVDELLSSLGIKTFIGKETISFITNLLVFRLEENLNKIKKVTHRTSIERYIVNIESIPSKPMRCITVDSPSHLYLITRKFIPTHNTVDAIFYDEVQDITSTAISNSNQMLKQSMYGPETKGIQVYFGTPKSKGSTFYKLWNSSNQQYYHLGCHECKNTFPLYTPESDEWEKVWIRDFIVKCPHCGCEQDKREAAGRGKWISTKDSNECQYIGFHINQMYMPKVKKEMFMSEKPGIHPINTERAFKNEVLGEFYDGDASPLTMEEIIQNCGLPEVKFVSNIPPGETLVLLGIDYGARSGLELLANPESKTNTGQSYTTAVVLFEKGPGLLQIAYATIFKRTDAASKKSLISQIMKRYSVNVAVGDIGYSNDFSNDMHIEYGDRYIVSRAGGRMIDHVKFNKDFFPKEISFDRDFYIGEIIEQIKKGQIKFPLGSYSINGIEGVDWLIQHCCNLELKPIISRNSDPTPHYVKAGENDGFMALLNAYIGYKFLITDGFSTKNPALLKDGGKKKGILATSGYVGRRL